MGVFRRTKRPSRRKISSAAPSTSRTTLRVYISIRFFFAQISIKKFLERKAGENTEKYSIFDFENPLKSRISGGRNDQAAVKFRVRPVMTTSIRFRIINYKLENQAIKIISCGGRFVKQNDRLYYAFSSKSRISLKI